MNIPQKPPKLIKFLELPIAVFAYIVWIIISNVSYVFVQALIEWRYEAFDYFFHLRIILMLVIYRLIANYIEKMNFGLKKLKDRVTKAVQSKSAMIPEEEWDKIRQMDNFFNGLLGMVFDNSKCARYFTIGVAVTTGVVLVKYLGVLG